MSLVVDASALVEAGLLTTKGRAVLRLLDRERASAPDLINAEVLGALRRLVAAGLVEPARARLAVADLAQSDIRRVSTGPLMARAWDLRDNLTPDDAMYVALAERLDCAILTLDGRLSRAPTLTVPVITI